MVLLSHMTQPPDSLPESEPVPPEDPVGRATHAAEEIAEVLDEVPDVTRHAVLKTIAGLLGPRGLRVLDVQDLLQFMPDQDPDAPHKKEGPRSHLTRTEILALLALRRGRMKSPRRQL